MTDYSQIPIPDDKPPEDYTFNERRAEILQLIERKGHPWGFNYSQLGRRYGVSHNTIRKDFDRLKDWYGDKIGEDAKQASDLAYRRIVQEHMDNGDFEKARRALDSWNGWLEDRGFEDKEADEVEIKTKLDDNSKEMLANIMDRDVQE
jgi:DeoR/GlpR family transcriptional regulator of sugar metabolism